MKIKLSTRLQSIAALIPAGSLRLLDVGCDHGRLAAYALLNKQVDSVLAIDIEAGPLRAAATTLQKYALENKSVCLLNNGLRGVSLEEHDCVVIAGMGGLEICDILDHVAFSQYLASGKKPEQLNLIVQAMKSHALLRVYLAHHGFVLRQECLVKEQNRVYVVSSYHFPARPIKRGLKEQLLDETDDERLNAIREQSGLSFEELYLGEELAKRYLADGEQYLSDTERYYINKQKRLLQKLRHTKAFISGLGHVSEFQSSRLFSESR